MGAAGRSRGDDASATVPSDAADVLFFTVADDAYVMGLTGLVNSLRLTGHDQRIVVLDVGLSDRSRALLRTECELVHTPPGDPVLHPYLLYPYAQNLGHCGVLVIVDSDVIVTASLEGVFSDARAGKITAMAEAKRDRWFPEWAQLLGLAGPIQPQPCVNTGFLAFSTERHPDLLSRWGELIEKVAADSPEWATGDADPLSPFSNYDQDVLNALLMSEYPTDAVAVFSDSQAPGTRRMRDDVRVRDAERLVGACHGEPTVILHDLSQPKSWQGGGIRGVHRDAYLLLLRRLLTGRDLAVRLPLDMLPPWLRPGLAGRARLRALSSLGRFRSAVQSVRRKLRRVVGAEATASLGAAGSSTVLLAAVTIIG